MVLTMKQDLILVSKLNYKINVPVFDNNIGRRFSVLLIIQAILLLDCCRIGELLLKRIEASRSDLEFPTAASFLP